MTWRFGVRGLLFILIAFSGSIAKAGEVRREAVILAKADREALLRGMMRYLESIEGIVQGMARNDMKAVAKSAKRAGMDMLADVSFEAALSVPPDFALKSMEAHQYFDVLAEEARDPGTKLAVTQRLGQILATCNDCHASYRLAK